MKAIHKYIAFATLALSAAACSQDDDFAPSYLSAPDAVRITAQVGTNDVTGGFTRSNPLGTAEEQAQFNTGDQISVTSGTQAPVTYQLGTEGWKPVGETYLKWQTNEMAVTAYYPVGKNDASATTFTVPTEYTEDKPIADADYMTYSGTQTKGDDKSINLTMQRKMVRMVITPKFNNQFDTGYSVTAIKVHANTKGYANGQPETGNITVTALQHEGAFYALLAPTNVELNKTFLTVTVTNNTDDTDVHTLTLTDIPPTEAGKSYSFTLTVGKDVASIGSVSVTDWTGGTISGGDAEEVKVTVTTNGNTATLTIPELATDAMVQEAISNLSADITTVIIYGSLAESQQNAVATALADKTISLYLPDMETSELSTALANEEDNISVSCGCIVENGTYLVYNADGLQAWHEAAEAIIPTGTEDTNNDWYAEYTTAMPNLTLAADITLTGEKNWTPLGYYVEGDIKDIYYPYIGTIDGNYSSPLYACWTKETTELSYGGEVSSKNGVGIDLDNNNAGVLKACYSFADTSAVANAITAMNTAIEEYNASAAEGRKCTYKWQVGTDGYPTLVKTE